MRGRNPELQPVHEPVPGGEVRMGADPVRAGLGSRVRRLHLHREPSVAQGVLDPEVERERIARTRVEAVLERGAIGPSLRNRPLCPADEAVDGVPPLGLVER